MTLRVIVAKPTGQICTHENVRGVWASEMGTLIVMELASDTTYREGQWDWYEVHRV